MTPLSCDEARALVSDLLAGALDAAAAAPLQAHLEGCEGCQGQAARLFRQHRALAELAALPQVPAVLDSIRRTLAAEGPPASSATSSPADQRNGRRRQPREAAKRTRWMSVAAAAAVLAVGLAAAWVTFGGEQPSVVARVESVTGEVLLLPERSPIAPGLEIHQGQSLETGRAGAKAILAFPDSTRIEIEADSVVAGIEEGEDGKRLSLSKGTLRARIAKQPADKPMVFRTPHGEAKVLGTTLRLVVETDPRKGVRVDVEEGKVQLRNLAGKTIDVPSGHYAVAAAGAELVAKPAAPRTNPARAARGTELIRAMPSRTWISVPGSQLRAALPSPLPPGEPTTIMAEWGGAAYDTKRDRLLVWNGGTYRGNEIYAFDIAALTWSRLWGPSSEAREMPPGSETYSDGRPTPRNTYGGLEYLPVQDVFWCQGGGLYPGGRTSTATWTFDQKSSAWRRRADAPPTEGGHGNVAVYDPVSAHVFYFAQFGLLEYDPARDVWTTRYGEPGWRSDSLSGAIDPTRRNLVFIGGGEAWRAALSSTGNLRLTRLSTTGPQAVQAKGNPGFAYDPVGDRFVAWAGGSSVYTLEPATWVWSEVAPASTNVVVPMQPAPFGTFGRFRYMPSVDAFIVVNSIDEEVFIYRLR